MIQHTISTLFVICLFGVAHPVLGNTVLENPLGETSTLTELLVKVLDIILVFAVPVIVFFIIYSGFLFVTAAGDTAKITTARTALTWAVIGGVIVIGARAITTVIENTVDVL